jgi:hypothetical protein
MAVYRCAKCSLPYADVEIEQGVCPGCKAPLGPVPGSPVHDVPTSTQTTTSLAHRAAPFLLGLFAGCLIGPAVLWAALRLSGSLSDGLVEQTQALQVLRAQKTEADKLATQSECSRQAAISAHAKALMALDAANKQAAALLKQKDDAAKQLRDARARLAEERGHRASLEKALAQQTKAGAAPTPSFVRDWQLLGPFASKGEPAHDTVYPPEREDVQLKKTYDGFGGPVKWRPYHSAEDKIDLAAFFQYREAGAAYAVSWVFSDRDQAVTLGVGSDDGVRLWLNGEQVHDVKGGRQARPAQDVVKAHLKKGWNEIRAKVDNIIGTWELYLEFRTEDGGQPLGLFSTNLQPSTAAR